MILETVLSVILPRDPVRDPNDPIFKRDGITHGIRSNSMEKGLNANLNENTKNNLIGDTCDPKNQKAQHPFRTKISRPVTGVEKGCARDPGLMGSHNRKYSK